MMKATIHQNRIRLENATAVEVQRAMRAFQDLFGVSPVVWIQGTFTGSAVADGGGVVVFKYWARVQSVGNVYITAQARGKEPAGVRPEKGDGGSVVALTVPLEGGLVQCDGCEGTWIKGAPLHAQNHQGICSKNMR